MSYLFVLISLAFLRGPPNDAVVRWDSKSKAYRLIVKPGNPANEWNQADKTGAGDARHAIATLYRLDSEERYSKLRSFPLENAVAPAEVLVSDDGRFIATLNEQFSQGIGPNALVIYGGDGRLRAKFSVEQLVPQDILGRLPRGNLGYQIDGLFICRPAVYWNERANFDVDGNSLIVELNPSRRNPRRAIRIDLTKEKLAPTVVPSPSAGIPIEVKGPASPWPAGPVPPPVRPTR